MQLLLGLAEDAEHDTQPKGIGVACYAGAKSVERYQRQRRQSEHGRGRADQRGRRPGPEGGQAAADSVYRRAVPEARLAEISQVAASSGHDPELDTLLRLHTETVCRRGGVLAQCASWRIMASLCAARMIAAGTESAQEVGQDFPARRGALQFLASHHRAAMITLRTGGPACRPCRWRAVTVPISQCPAEAKMARTSWAA
jgi:hypothetical protein